MRHSIFHNCGLARRALVTGQAATDVTDPTTIRRNVRLLYAEIAAASILGAIATFNAAFAIRLGASRELVALLTALPPLLMALTSVPLARFVERRANRRPWLLASLFLGRAGYVVVAVVPWLFPGNPSLWLVLVLILLTLPNAFFTSAFQALLAEVVPESRRAFVFSRRSILWSIGVVIISALAGGWLDRMPFPENYTWMYLFGFGTVMLSNLFLHRLVMPATPAVNGAAHSQTNQDGVPASPVRLTRPLRRFLTNMGIYQFGLTLPSALFTIFYVEVLGVSDGWLGLNSAAGSAGVIVGYYVWARLTRRYGFMWGLKRSTLLTWVFPVSLALFPQLTIILAANFVVNLVHPGVDLSSFNTVLRLSDPAHRTVLMGWYNAVLNGSMFLAPLAGVWLSSVIGIPATLLLSGILRLTGGALMWLNRIEPAPSAGGPSTAQ